MDQVDRLYEAHRVVAIIIDCSMAGHVKMGKVAKHPDDCHCGPAIQTVREAAFNEAADLAAASQPLARAIRALAEKGPKENPKVIDGGTVSGCHPKAFRGPEGD